MQRELIQYKADLHFHSRNSDGVSRPSKIITAALEKKIAIIALTDHDTLDGWKEFWTAAESVQHYHQLLAILGVEVSTTQGHVLLLFPDRDQAENFSQWYVPKKPKDDREKLHTIEDVAPRALAENQAVCIFPHPGFKLIHGFSLEDIQTFLQRIDPESGNRVGIEVYNWMTQVFLWNYGSISQANKAFASEHNLAQFSNTDGHRAAHVGKGS